MEGTFEPSKITAKIRTFFLKKAFHLHQIVNMKGEKKKMCTTHQSMCKIDQRNQSFLTLTSKKLNTEINKTKHLKINLEDKFFYDIFVPVKDQGLANEFSLQSLLGRLFSKPTLNEDLLR